MNNYEQPPFAVGLGYDVHQFAEDRKLYLGGVLLSETGGLLGHSDADVLLHALMDALLGAAGLPDIGNLFPNDDEAFRDVDSKVLLAEVARRIDELGWKIGNVDMSVIAEKPKIAPHLEAMKSAIGGVLNLPVGRIAIKATTNEKMGFVGREEGIAAMATALLYRS